MTVTTTGLGAGIELLRGFSERRTRATIATALTRAAMQGKRAAQVEMAQSFDRPTPYALGGVYVRMATAGRLEAEVGVADYAWTKSGTPAAKFLGPGVQGGGRHIKRFELALQASGAMPKGWQSVPATGPNSAARFDAFGNISRGQLVQILSQVGAELTAGYRRSLPRHMRGEDAKRARATATKRRRAFGRAGGQYVALPQGRGKLKPGIYLAGARDFGAKWGLGRTGRLEPVLLFVRSTSYRPRFDFYGTVNQAAAGVLGAEMGRAIEEQAVRLAAKLKGQP